MSNLNILYTHRRGGIYVTAGDCPYTKAVKTQSASHRINTPRSDQHKLISISKFHKAINIINRCRSAASKSLSKSTHIYHYRITKPLKRHNSEI